MLKISKMADYAILLMSHLVRKPYEKQMVSANDLSKGTHIPQPTVSKLLKILLDAHLLSSQRGTDGGYQLSRSADRIRLLDVMHAIQGVNGITECSNKVNTCTLDNHCTLKHNWLAINAHLQQVFIKITLADMIEPAKVHSLLGTE
jgi:FeS assembly SUF system regulator